MNCTKCGNKIEEGAKFCNLCGEKINTQDNKKNINLIKYKEIKGEELVKNSSNKTWKIIIGVVIVLIAAIAITELVSESEEVLSVKNANFKYYTYDMGYTDIGTAFENYFSNTKWQSFISEEGIEIVQFDGEFMYYDKNTDCSIQFEIYSDGTFDIYAVEFNGIPQNKLIIAALIDEVMESSRAS